MVCHPTEKDPCYECMGIVTGVISLHDIAHTEQVELDLSTAPSDVDWKEDWPSDAAADEANGRCNLQIAEEQIAVERLVIQDIGVRNLEESPNPVEETFGKIWGAFPETVSLTLGYAMPIRSRLTRVGESKCKISANRSDAGSDGAG